eukprot:782340-Pelagomonas_calceolata.AAC.8
MQAFNQKQLKEWALRQGKDSIQKDKSTPAADKDKGAKAGAVGFRLGGLPPTIAADALAEAAKEPRGGGGGGGSGASRMRPARVRDEWEGKEEGMGLLVLAASLPCKEGKLAAVSSLLAWSVACMSVISLGTWTQE